MPIYFFALCEVGQVLYYWGRFGLIGAVCIEMLYAMGI